MPHAIAVAVRDGKAWRKVEVGDVQRAAVVLFLIVARLRCIRRWRDNFAGTTRPVNKRALDRIERLSPELVPHTVTVTVGDGKARRKVEVRDVQRAAVVLVVLVLTSGL